MRSWLLLAAGLLIAAAGLGWMSATLVRLDRGAAASESSRLALWRMDLLLSRLMAEESARPPTTYLGGVEGPAARLHFDLAPGGMITTSGASPELVAELRAVLHKWAAPVAVAAAIEPTRNAFEFNRRNAFAGNFVPTPEQPQQEEAVMASAWYGDALVLVRRVRLGDGVHSQGVWLNWERLQTVLLQEVRDLLPAARLEPVKTAERGDELRLASIPARLVPGAATDDPERTPIGWVISAAWAALAIVAAALAALLFGSLALDERRSAFVSAVTHELRTPLTTFKLYAEMLEDGMVPAEKQKEYLATLRQEANRLGYLVENVLAWAQIEKGRKGKPLEKLTVAQLLERILPRLEARAAQAQFTLSIAAIPAITVLADRISVEQILFNLIDNACKYAASNGDERNRIAISFETSGDRLAITVVDSGPGVSAAVARKLFEPLRKSAAEAADGAHGIGLGLALSRRLARAMGGDLRHCAGAAFELSLKAVTSV